MKILVIDDDPAMTELLKLSLAPTLFTVTTANSGMDGIELVKSVQPDIILLDLMMPEMNVWQVCKKIRKFSDVPIIIMSALDNPGLVADALDAGADDYLIKPIPNRVLIAHIEKLVRRNKRLEQELLAVKALGI
jgi:DNA-binding response OmpR family regulator